jgi:hypothetical protein
MAIKEQYFKLKDEVEHFYLTNAVGGKAELDIKNNIIKTVDDWEIHVLNLMGLEKVDSQENDIELQESNAVTSIPDQEIK